MFPKIATRLCTIWLVLLALMHLMHAMPMEQQKTSHSPLKNRATIYLPEKFVTSPKAIRAARSLMMKAMAEGVTNYFPVLGITIEKDFHSYPFKTDIGPSVEDSVEFRYQYWQNLGKGSELHELLAGFVSLEPQWDGMYHGTLILRCQTPEQYDFTSFPKRSILAKPMPRTALPA
ncbi:hypothetical protein C8R42DRAFT_639990 [Lentinula raphanica]|nr:hypothetical protein C8R42DRAFT_639990 [Lentinula raphanica]